MSFLTPKVFLSVELLLRFGQSEAGGITTNLSLRWQCNNATFSKIIYSLNVSNDVIESMLELLYKIFESRHGTASWHESHKNREDKSRLLNDTENLFCNLFDCCRKSFLNLRRSWIQIQIQTPLFVIVIYIGSLAPIVNLSEWTQEYFSTKYLYLEAIKLCTSENFPITERKLNHFKQSIGNLFSSRYLFVGFW